jgi:branched-chain amino acid transport system permease protein
MASTAVATPSRRRLSPNAIWSIGFVVVAIATFVFYNNVLSQLQNSVVSGVQQWANLSALCECLVYAIMALGLNIVVGYAGLLDLGYVAFWAIGSYVGAYLMSAFIFQLTKGYHLGAAAAANGQPGIHFNFWLVLLCGGVVCAIFGILIGAPTLRLRGDYLAIVTLGFGEIIPEFLRNGDKIDGLNLTNGVRGITGLDPIDTAPFKNLKGVPEFIFGVNSPFKLLIMFFLVGVCLFVSLRIRSGRLGRSWLAIREDELAANMMGVSLVKTKLSAYAVGAFFGGLGGVAYATNIGGAISTTFNFQKSVFILIMVVLGGMGNVWGVMLGAIVLAWINNTGMQEFGNLINGWFGTSVEIPNYTFLIFGIILLLMMLFRREGLLPERRTQQILHEATRTEMESLGANVEAGQAENAEIVAEQTARQEQDRRDSDETEAVR